MAKIEPQYTINENPLKLDHAYGDPNTGYWIQTPRRTNRVWPKWSLRWWLNSIEYPDLTRRFDEGGPPTQAVIDQMQHFTDKTHIEVAPGVFVLRVKSDGMIFYPMVISAFRFDGNVSRWLDSLNKKQTIVFPEVTSLQLAQMLHRRGYALMSMADDEAVDDDWLPVHIRFGQA